MSVNDDRGPSIDSLATDKAKKNDKNKHGGEALQERLAHRGCNTRKGAIAAVIPWPEHLFVVDPAPIITSVDRLQRKMGREVMARCPSQADADQAADWLRDRITRLRPGSALTTEVERVGGQFLLILRA
ncbi:MAG: hypothetical protein JWL72_3929 [Ilumatobacteraceae bacterium]|nr:hypothetical protein [Ilumatobacteraceae bacterium]